LRREHNVGQLCDLRALLTVLLQTEMTLVRHAGEPVDVPNDGKWYFPGSALSASMSQLHATSGMAKLHSARWVVAWNPRAPHASPSGVQLVHADSGPSNVCGIAQFLKSKKTSPVVDAADVTAALNGILAGGASKFLGHQLVGNGTNSPLLYSSVIECVWQL
jgi:hypothetical protein